MSWKRRGYIVLLVVLAFFYTYYELHRPKEIDWTETFSRHDKIPYGTYVATKSLPYLFPEQEIVFSRLPVMEQLEALAREEKPVAYIFVANHFMADENEIKYLLDFAGKGNYLFIAAFGLPDPLLNRLHLDWKEEFRQGAHRLQATGGKSYVFGTELFAFFRPEEGFEGEVLGTVDSLNRPDFIRIPYGKGEVMLNLNPAAFVNYWVLDSVQGDYYYRALSYLPPSVKVVWDDYTVLGAGGGSSPLRVILRYPALRGAWFLILLCGILYLLFRMKREQRAIPVIRPPENKTLEFVGAVSSLYYKQKDHYRIAAKQIDFFLEEMSRRYRVNPDPEESGFAGLLAERSGKEEKTVRKLVNLMTEIRSRKRATEGQLRELVRFIEIVRK